jgi:hypothetical protein
MVVLIVGQALALVNLAVTSQVRDDGEVAATAWNFASECFRVC